ncbi:MAG TPA: SMI1/KNR4 family protein [Pirellulales bacterium]
MSNPLCDQLAELARLDPNRKVFGAAKHGYQCTRADHSDLLNLETALGTALPVEYRRFLLEVGYGAGPYYGIWNPAESLAELQSLAQDYEAEEGRPVRTTDAFPLSRNDADTFDETVGSDGGPVAIESEWPCGGCLPICHHGCTFWSVLVLRGEFVGRIWDVACFVGYSGEWAPGRRAPGWWEFGMPHPRKLPRLPSPPTFEEWYRGWIERCLTDLSERP